MVYYCDVEYLRRYRIAIGIFVLAVAVRFLFLPFSVLHPEPLTFSGVAYDGYYVIAKNLLSGVGYYGDSPVERMFPDSIRMPLYPVLIAAFAYLTGGYKTLLILQMLIGSTIPLLGRKLLTICKMVKV